MGELIGSELFSAGDYVSAAMRGDSNQWQYHAARGILGRPREAISKLEGFDVADARFYSAVLSWMDGDEDTAARALERIDTQHARNLLALIRKPRIRVLSQLPWSKGGPNVLLEGSGLDPKFEVRNIGFGEDDLQNHPFASIHEFFSPETKPDFYVCNMVEWHQIPPNIQELDCPIFGHTSDFDVHIQGVYRWLRVFDEILVCDHEVEYEAIRRIADVPVSTYVNTFGHPFGMPQAQRRQRDIDVFVSGSLFNAYQPDKALQVHQLLRIPDASTLFIHGHIATSEYLELVSRSKIVPCYCRHWGGLLTRAMESMCMGSITLVQEGSIHTLWAGEEDGLFTYPTETGPGKLIERLLAEYPLHEENVFRNIATVRNEFDPATVSSRYFRYCTYLAARPRPPRDLSRSTYVSQKRNILIRGWVPAAGHHPTLSVICEGNVTTLGKHFERSQDPIFLNDMARELIIMFCNRALEPNNLDPDRSELTRALQIYRDAIDRFPGNLVLRFNFIRACLHFGAPDEIIEAIEEAEQILAVPSDKWQIAVLDDLFPYDYCSTFFNYRSHLDEVVALMMTKTQTSDRLRDLVLASLHHYYGRHRADLNHTRKAVELDPDFPFYKATHAEALLWFGRAEDLDEAKGLLLDLCDNSMVAVKAYWLLRHIELRLGHRLPEVEALDHIMAKAQENVLLTENHYQKLRTPYCLQQHQSLSGYRGYVPHLRSSGHPGDYDVSIILVDKAGTNAAIGLESLQNQSHPREKFEIIYVELFERIMPGVVGKVDTLMSCGQLDFLFHTNIGYNFGLWESKGQIIVFADGSKPFPQTFIADIVQSFSQTEPNRKSARPGIMVLDGTPEVDARTFARGIYSLAVRRDDVIRVAGLDQHEIFHGAYGGTNELALRLQNSGLTALSYGGGQKVRVAPWWEVSDNKAVQAARRIAPALFTPKRVQPQLPELFVGIISSQLGADGRTLGSTEKFILRTARLVQRAATSFADEIERNHKVMPAVRSVAKRAAKRLLAKVLSPAGYKALAHWHASRRRW